MASVRRPPPRAAAQKFLGDFAPGDAVALAMGDVIVCGGCNGGVLVALCDRSTWRELSASVNVRKEEPVREVLRIGVDFYTQLAANQPPGADEVDPLRGARRYDDDQQLDFGAAAAVAAAASGR